MLSSLSKVPIGIVQSGENDAVFPLLHCFPIFYFSSLLRLLPFISIDYSVQALKKYVFTSLNPVFFTKETLPIKCFLMKLGEVMLSSLLDTQSQKKNRKDFLLKTFHEALSLKAGVSIHFLPPLRTVFV